LATALVERGLSAYKVLMSEVFVDFKIMLWTQVWERLTHGGHYHTPLCLSWEDNNKQQQKLCARSFIGMK